MSLPAAAINKCTGADGKVTFQDAPCSTTKSETINVRPASGQAISPRVTKPSDAGAPAAPLTEAARLEGIIAASQRSRRANDLRERLLPDAERAVKDHREACEARQKELSAQQYAYQKNLYGKTHAAQIASEMAAAAARCDTKDRELKETVDAFIKECTSLRCRG
ncbi:MAG: DUF4124 domain-containing protein [Comamonadaceae bacterium]|nr:MAG: DUF4124 domain-containing protein [Comamonadaceae bacterium]